MNTLQLELFNECDEGFMSDAGFAEYAKESGMLIPSREIDRKRLRDKINGVYFWLNRPGDPSEEQTILRAGCITMSLQAIGEIVYATAMENTTDLTITDSDYPEVKDAS